MRAESLLDSACWIVSYWWMISTLKFSVCALVQVRVVFLKSKFLSYFYGYMYIVTCHTSIPPLTRSCRLQTTYSFAMFL